MGTSLPRKQENVSSTTLGRMQTQTDQGNLLVDQESRAATTPEPPLDHVYRRALDQGWLAKSSDRYKTKYQAAKETSKFLREALTDEAETARYNYLTARDQEAKRLSTSLEIDTLEDELRSLRLEAQVLEGRTANTERERLVAERKLVEKTIELEIDERKKEYNRREDERARHEDDFARKQWEEIQASASPVRSRPPRRPPKTTDIIRGKEERPRQRQHSQP